MGGAVLADNPLLIGIELFVASIWIGSLVCLAVVANAARASLEPSAQVAFFQALGRRYGVVGNTALAVAIGIGLAMVWPPSSWGALEDTLLALTCLLVVATASGIHQARTMTRLRRRLLDAPGDRDLEEAIRRGTTTAVALRGAIGAISIAILSVAAVLIGS